MSIGIIYDKKEVTIMDIQPHRDVQIECEKYSEHFKKIDFPLIAATFAKAANTIKNLVDVIETLNKEP